MRAMVLRAPGDLVLDDVARPRRDASQVQVRVTHSGICGTDFKIFSGAIPVSYPRIMGHEMFGEVVDAGDADRLRPGDRVVFGLGVTGQLHVQLAKARGASPVIGVTRSAAKRALAETLGADITLPGGEGAIDKVREATGGRGADAVIETTGILPSVAASVNMARAGGQVLLFGIITAQEGALPFYDLYFKELSLISARVAKSEDYPSSIALVQRGTVRLEPLVSDVRPLEELKAAIGMLGSDSATRMKIIMEHNKVG